MSSFDSSRTTLTLAGFLCSLIVACNGTAIAADEEEAAPGCCVINVDQDCDGDQAADREIGCQIKIRHKTTRQVSVLEMKTDCTETPNSDKSITSSLRTDLRNKLGGLNVSLASLGIHRIGTTTLLITGSDDVSVREMKKTDPLIEDSAHRRFRDPRL